MTALLRPRFAIALVALAGASAACGAEDAAAPSVPDGTLAATDSAPATTPPTTAAPTTAAPTTAAPTTAAPTTAAPTTETGDPTTLSETTDDPASAASAAWALVFDSSAPFDDKAPHLADAEALRPTVDAYADAGAGFGGISLVPTAADVAGDEATITYDVNFGANPAYTDQSGSISIVDGVWTVSRDEFCSFMVSARLSCP